MTAEHTYAEMGVVDHDEARDVLSYWRVHLYTDPKIAPVELLFEEEPEHRVIEELMARTDAVTVGIYPPMADDPQTVAEAEARVLAVARGLKSLNDVDGVAALVTASAAYQSLYRSTVLAGEEI
jgi:hypothetical protein